MHHCHPIQLVDRIFVPPYKDLGYILHNNEEYFDHRNAPINHFGSGILLSNKTLENAKQHKYVHDFLVTIITYLLQMDSEVKFEILYTF